MHMFHNEIWRKTEENTRHWRKKGENCPYFAPERVEMVKD